MSILNVFQLEMKTAHSNDYIYNDLPVYSDNLGHPRGSYVEDDSGECRSLASLLVHLVVIIVIVFIVMVISIIFIITLNKYNYSFQKSPMVLLGCKV